MTNVFQIGPIPTQYCRLDKTTSKPVTTNDTNASIVNSRPSFADRKTDQNNALSLNLSPAPARSTMQIYTQGLPLNKSFTLSLISTAVIVVKTMQLNTSNKVVQMDVSSLIPRVYTVKVLNGERVVYKEFVKL